MHDTTTSRSVVWIRAITRNKAHLTSRSGRWSAKSSLSPNRKLSRWPPSRRRGRTHACASRPYRRSREQMPVQRSAHHPLILRRVTLRTTPRSHAERIKQYHLHHPCSFSPFYRPSCRSTQVQAYPPTLQPSQVCLTQTLQVSELLHSASSPLGLQVQVPVSQRRRGC